jgi:hypothetical protein
MRYDKIFLGCPTEKKQATLAEFKRISEAVDSHASEAICNQNPDGLLQVVRYLESYRIEQLKLGRAKRLKFDNYSLSNALSFIEHKYRQHFLDMISARRPPSQKASGGAVNPNPSAWVASERQRLADERLRKSLDAATARPRPHRKVDILISDPFVDDLVGQAALNSATQDAVPWAAEFLLDIFLSAKDREAVLGDLHEQYAKRVGKYGRRGAQIWLYKQVAASMGPLAWKMLAVGLSEWLRRKLS